jgi:hypothetical protein
MAITYLAALMLVSCGYYSFTEWGIDLRQATLNGRSAVIKKCMGMMSTSSVRRDGLKGVKLANAAEIRRTSISVKEQCHAPASKFSKKRNSWIALCG